MHKIFYTEKARLDLRKMNISTARRIVKKIYFFGLQENPLRFAKKLTNSALGQYRFRIGDYRAIFDADKKGGIYFLMILRIKHRKDVYDL